jgi:hypothetical protein
MKTRAFRAGLIASLVTAVAMTGASNAWACNLPRIHIADTQVGPGDTIPYALSDTQQGATYTLAVEGRPIHPDGANCRRTAVGWECEDTTAAQGYRGTFTMPDLGGSTRSVYVKGEIMHMDESAEHTFDGPWTSEPQVQFTRPGSPATTPPASGPTPLPAPTEAPGRHRTPVDTHPGTPGGGSAPTGSGPTSPAAPGPPSSPVTPGDPSGSPPADGSSASNAVTEGLRQAASRDRARRAPAPVPVRLPRWVERSVGTPLTRPDEAPVGPSTILVGIALIVLAGAALVIVRLLRRGGATPSGDRVPVVPPWIPPDVRREAWARDVLIEAELQELIAEEHAKELAADRDGAPAAPG